MQRFNLVISFRICLVCVASFFTIANAQENVSFDIPASFNPVGSGARALGMGGAFIAVADDATAASWNPAGLIQLERSEISIVANNTRRTEKIKFGVYPPADGNHTISFDDLNYLSGAYRFSLLNRNMIVSLNYQNLFDMTRKWSFPYKKAKLSSDVDYDQDGSLSAIGIAYSVEVTPRFSFGYTLNFWDDNLSPNKWHQNTRTSNLIVVNNFLRVEDTRYRRDTFTFKGINMNIGFLWQPSDKLTLGAIIKTPFTADINWESKKQESTKTISTADPLQPQVLSETTNNENRTADLKLTMPISYGIGLAYRITDELTVSADIYTTEWQNFIYKDENGVEKSAVTAPPKSDSVDNIDYLANIDPTHQLRMGIEYLYIQPDTKYVFPFRAGLFYDPSPARKNPDDYYGITLGTGMFFSKYAIDIAYQYRFGNDVGSTLLQNLNFSMDVKEHLLYTSLIIHF